MERECVGNAGSEGQHPDDGASGDVHGTGHMARVRSVGVAQYRYPAFLFDSAIPGARPKVLLDSRDERPPPRRDRLTPLRLLHWGKKGDATLYREKKGTQLFTGLT